MRALAKTQPTGPIMVTWQRHADTWVCEDSNGARVLVEAPGTARMKDVEEFLASGPEIEIV